MANIKFSTIKHAMNFKDLTNGTFFMYPMIFSCDKRDLYMKIDLHHAYSFRENGYFEFVPDDDVYAIDSENVTININL